MECDQKHWAEEAEKNRVAAAERAAQEVERAARAALVWQWQDRVDQALEDGLLKEDEETELVRFSKEHSLQQSELDQNGHFMRVVKAAVLRDLMNGRVNSDRIQVTGNVPFMLRPGEILIWVFNSVPFYEDRTQTHYEGRSAGVSVRIVRGIYYRTSAFKGYPVQTTQTVEIDCGILGVTQKHIYFAGPRKSFRIDHRKIVAIHPYSDGVGIQKDGVTAKPQTFRTGDGWFTYNLLKNVGNVA